MFYLPKFRDFEEDCSCSRRDGWEMFVVKCVKKRGMGFLAVWELFCWIKKWESILLSLGTQTGRLVLDEIDPVPLFFII